MERNTQINASVLNVSYPIFLFSPFGVSIEIIQTKLPLNFCLLLLCRFFFLVCLFSKKFSCIVAIAIDTIQPVCDPFGTSLTVTSSVIICFFFVTPILHLWVFLHNHFGSSESSLLGRLTAAVFFHFVLIFIANFLSFVNFFQYFFFCSNYNQVLVFLLCKLKLRSNEETNNELNWWKEWMSTPEKRVTFVLQ